jgi:hypothetical protein
MLVIVVGVLFTLNFKCMHVFTQPTVGLRGDESHQLRISGEKIFKTSCDC